MEIHWRAPIQAKGFLKLVEMFIALLAFSLVAGFSVTHNLHCTNWLDPGSTNASANVQTYVKYPFSKASISISIKSSTPVQTNISGDYSLPSVYQQAGQFFVVWGIFSIFYGIIALLVYVLLTANKKMEWLMNYLILTDLILHVVWVLCWLIASIEWAAVQVQMKNYLTEIYKKNDELGQYCQAHGNNQAGSYVQAAIADVFGFTSIVLWGINIYWVLIDTGFYIEWRNKREHTPLVE